MAKTELEEATRACTQKTHKGNLRFVVRSKARVRETGTFIRVDLINEGIWV